MARLWSGGIAHFHRFELKTQGPVFSRFAQVDVEILNKQKEAPPLVKYQSQSNISFAAQPSSLQWCWMQV